MLRYKYSFPSTLYVYSSAVSIFRRSFHVRAFDRPQHVHHANIFSNDLRNGGRGNQRSAVRLSSDNGAVQLRKFAVVRESGNSHDLSLCKFCTASLRRKRHIIFNKQHSQCCRNLRIISSFFREQ